MKKQGFAKVRDLMKGKGFIVALVFSVAAVGFSTYYAYSSILGGLSDESENKDLFVDVDKNQSGVPKETAPSYTQKEPAAIITDAPSVPAAEVPAATEANSFFSPKAPRIIPVEGEIINPYSDGELVKSETLNLWQTHDGIDIAAADGAEIKAAGEGTVLNIWEDGLWGICVTIDHGDGYVSGYMGVDKSVPVTMGQKVACGDVIAKVGNTAECECGLPSHLHFQVKKDGAYIDPLTFTENN